MKNWIKKIVTGAIILSSSIGFVGCNFFNTNPKESGYVFKNYEENYYVNDTFSIVGTKLFITDETGRTEEVTVTEDMIREMPDMSTAGEKTVVILYNGLHYQFTINVENRTNEHLLAKLQKFLRHYESNKESVINASVKTNLIANHLGEEAAINEEEAIKLLSQMFKDDALANALYNAVVDGLVEGSFNLDENLIVNTNELTARLDALKVLDSIQKDVQNFDLRTYLIDLILPHTDTYYIAKVSSYINQWCEIKSVSGQKAINEVISKYYYKLKNFECFEPVDAYVELLEKINVHSLNIVVKEATKDLKSMDVETILHLPSNLIEQQLLNYGKVVTVENLMLNLNENAKLNFETSVEANHVVAFQIRAEKTLMRAVEDAVIALAKCEDVEDLNTIALDLLKESADYTQRMANNLQRQKDSNLVLIRTESNGKFSIDVPINENGLLDFETQINDFTAAHDEFEKYYNDINEYGFIGAVEQNALVEQLFETFDYPEEDKQQAIDKIYSILNSELEGEDLYWAIADIVCPNSADENIEEIKSIVKSCIGNGVVSAIEDHQLVEMLFEYIANYPEEHKQEAINTIYAILKEQKTGKDLYLDIVNVLTPNDNEYYIDYTCNMINQYLFIETVTGQNEIRALISKYFENLKTATDFDVKTAYTEILSAIHVHSTNEIIKTATKDLTSLETEQMVHLISDVVYTQALEDVKIAIRSSNGSPHYDYTIINTSEAQELVERYALNLRKLIKAHETGLWNILNANNVESIFDVSLDLLNIQHESIVEEIEIVNILENNCWMLGEESVYINQEGEEVLLFTFRHTVETHGRYDGENGNFEYTWIGYQNTLTDLTKLQAEIANLYDQVDLLKSLIFEPEQAINALIKKYKADIVSTSLTMVQKYLKVEPESLLAYDLENLLNESIDSYLNDEFNKEEFLASIEKLINDYATDETKTVLNVGYMLYNSLNYDETIDYNEVFKDIELPEQVESIDYNKLMAKVMDKNTYDIFKFNDVEIRYITDDSGDIVAEQLTLKVNVDFDVIISSLKGDVEFSLVLDFEPDEN